MKNLGVGNGEVISYSKTMKKYLFTLGIIFILGCSSTTSIAKMRSMKSSGQPYELRKMVTEKAEEYLGVHYQRDGKHPGSGFDCSGFVAYVYNQFGWNLKGGSSDIAHQGIMKSQDQLQKGDLVFFGKQRGGKTHITHVGIITESNKHSIVMIHSSSTIGISKEDIKKSDYWKNKFLFAKDVF